MAWAIYITWHLKEFAEDWAKGWEVNYQVGPQLRHHRGQCHTGKINLGICPLYISYICSFQAPSTYVMHSPLYLLGPILIQGSSLSYILGPKNGASIGINLVPCLRSVTPTTGASRSPFSLHDLTIDDWVIFGVSLTVPISLNSNFE